ncbi:response regulator [Pelagibacterium montanilacus]|uniref:response regulator n=1 Tax=Pelagibacterium montanilacus TaxID=2185280 RepID=UPI000F8F1397|nr:response regulator [Pelagibacterium montanilacus]
MKSCLIVDDSSVVRKVARRILETMDFIVDEAEDGEEALDKCKREMPDVIFLDWQMPIMNGIEFLKALRSYSGGDAPAVIFCTTERDIGQMALARKVGATDHMLKPFDQAMFEEKFQAYV